MSNDKKLVGKLKKLCKLTHIERMNIVAMIAEENQTAYMKGYDSGYNDGVASGEENNE